MIWDYRIVDIKRTQGVGGGTWYEYTIANDSTTVAGRRRGSKQEVSRFVQDSVQRLNNRHKAAYAKGM